MGNSVPHSQSQPTGASGVIHVPSESNLNSNSRHHRTESYHRNHPPQSSSSFSTRNNVRNNINLQQLSSTSISSSCNAAAGGYHKEQKRRRLHSPLQSYNSNLSPQPCSSTGGNCVTSTTNDNLNGNRGTDNTKKRPHNDNSGNSFKYQSSSSRVNNSDVSSSSRSLKNTSKYHSGDPQRHHPYAHGGAGSGTYETNRSNHLVPQSSSRRRQNGGCYPRHPSSHRSCSRR